MKRTFTPLSVILLFSLLPSLLFAQESRYSLMLNAGKFTPVANVDALDKDADMFQKSLFGDKHYLTIQFNELPTEAMKAQLKLAGVELIDYLPYFSYTASVNKNLDLAVLKTFNVRSVLNLADYQKTVPFILSNTVPAYAEKFAGFADLGLLLYENLSATKLNAALNELHGRILLEEPTFRMITVRVPKENVRAVAGLPFVQWAEFVSPQNVPENTPGRLSHRINNLNDGVRNLKGDGMRIAAFDEVASPHIDLSLPAGRLVSVDPGAGGSHGTHLSGTIAGKGIINPLARGMAPNATLYSYNGYDGGGSAFDLNLTQMATVIPANQLISSNHSYHDGLGVQCVLGGAATNYTLRARNVDVNINNNDYHLHVHSAGNAQASCASGWFSITGTGKVAKNNLVVAALTAADAMTSYSSFGPSNDGRVKPEISAVGDGVFSTHIPLNTYTNMSGTSMATPGIAGTVAIIAQRYKELNSGTLPPSTLIKNVTLNTAQDLGNVGPDYRFGYGRVNALGAVKILEENRFVMDNVTTGTQKDVTITIPANTARLRVMLTWNDPAGAANASLPLVNNLDLRVINGATTSLPWVLNPASPTSAATQIDDNISNIEQVTINNPPAGTYTLRVLGEAVPTGPNQIYALTWDVDGSKIEVAFPNGGESLGAGTTHAITWDNAGVTGTQTVEYSIDNGANWTVISSTVAAATTRLNWSVPAVNTSTALIRVSSGGTIIDMSDATFSILGNVSGFSGSGVSCNAGEVIFTWGSVTNATHYDIYNLNTATGDFVVLASNVTGTTYTATGLTPNTSMWFTIRAKNNTTGSVSDRGIAINVTVSNGGGGIGALGAIAGTTSICGSASSVTYTVGAVSGATQYTWTVPTGAVIISGQGTTSITVNFPAGSSSGNVSVRAGNGACETAPVTLAVTIGAEPALPSVGGNETQTVCPGNALPTLTATATVPAGHTVVWYSAATGGAVIASPTLSTAGTVTYYAASRNSASGCESSNRVPVTLTINAVASATANAATATSFCAGGSVVITANSGTTYAWTKDGVAISGATSQSYTANASGLYAVTVTNGTCTSTSTPIVVTVNALPTASITAGGSLNFCQGNNVLLTASAGSSWTWSNGQTTQSITVTTAGNYTVTVRNAAGCTATSAATSVAVSPSPVVSISAAPYTALFPGLKTNLTANVTPPGNYQYAWFKNGVAVPGANSATLPNIDLSNIGSYTVTVTNTGTGLPCSNTSAPFAIADSATTKLFIYPSPNNGQYSVVYYTPTANTKNTVVVFDSKGALVYKRTYTLASAYQPMAVDMQRNSKGIYRVVLFNSAGQKLGHGSVVVQ